MRMMIVATLSICASHQLLAQSPVSYPFTVVPVSATSAGATSEIAYRLTSDANSTQLIYLFDVPATVPLVRVSPPDSAWNVLSQSGPRGWVEWQVLDSTAMLPGASSPPLTYSAQGVPGVVTAWFYPYWPMPTEADVADAEASGKHLTPPPMFVTTVGIVPPPDLSAAGAPVSYLVDLTSGACQLGWISPSGICNSLRQKLNAAGASLARGDTGSARNQLNALLHELDAQRGKHVSDNAYWLLTANVTYVLGKM